MGNVVHIGAASSRGTIEVFEQVLADLKAGKVTGLVVVWADDEGHGHYVLPKLDRPTVIESALRRAASRVSAQIWEPEHE